MTTKKQDSRLERLRECCEDAGETISAWRLDEHEHSTEEDSLLGFLSFVHLAIRDAVDACENGHLTPANANHWLYGNRAKPSNAREWALFESAIQSLSGDIARGKTLFQNEDHARAWEVAAHSIFLATLLHGLLRKNDLASEQARDAINARYSRPGGIRDKRAELRRVWATGRYSSRDVCAEQECGAFGVAVRVARNWLKGTPDPSPWPAKRLHSTA
jgi:hypothetical protein